MRLRQLRGRGPEGGELLCHIPLFIPTRHCTARLWGGLRLGWMLLRHWMKLPSSCRKLKGSWRELRLWLVGTPAPRMLSAPLTHSLTEPRQLGHPLRLLRRG